MSTKRKTEDQRIADLKAKIARLETKKQIRALQTSLKKKG